MVSAYICGLRTSESRLLRREGKTSACDMCSAVGCSGLVVMTTVSTLKHESPDLHVRGSLVGASMGPKKIGTQSLRKCLPRILKTGPFSGPQNGGHVKKFHTGGGSTFGPQVWAPPFRTKLGWGCDSNTGLYLSHGPGVHPGDATSHWSHVIIHRLRIHACASHMISF